MATKRPSPTDAGAVGGPTKRTALSWASEVLPPEEAQGLSEALGKVYGAPAPRQQPHQQQGQPQDRQHAASSTVVDLTMSDDEDAAEDAAGAASDEDDKQQQPSIDSDGLEVYEPEQPAASAATTATITLGDDDDECVVVGRSSSAIEMLPHARADCVVHPFAAGTYRSFCTTCYCYVCDIPAADCANWAVHCEATHADPFWREERTQQKQQRGPATSAAAEPAARTAAEPAARTAAAARTGGSSTPTAAPNNAVAYVAAVKRAMADTDPAKWKKFLTVLRVYREEGKQTAWVLESLTPLMDGRPALLAGLHKFIKPSGGASPSPAAAAAPSPPVY
jgi:histone deacetylase complex regulatory component SIN3